MKLSLRDHLVSGKPIMIFDSPSREGEVDLVFYAGAITKSSIYTLRTMAGGLICFATSLEIGNKLGLKLAYEYFREIGLGELVKKPSYGDYPAFSIWVNHKSVKTGISDEDRARTIKALYEVVLLAMKNEEEARGTFLDEFQAPGHVPILLAKRIEERRGHTELSVRLMERLGLPPTAVFAEMLDYGRSMSLEKAKEIASTLGIPLLSGDEILKLFL
ncbi:3,4-dihydroxy-2-butanone 4-phosphate synthase [Ignicoccus pacificus DSM 13166]|uniref:3,4-dihydroxy-2-butanone 4-phosphate synthase n=1 Tax=Ignicoccus pacificus DSM 13166 TaxID=940294 RepID=A0A977K9R9_9CREN|nr:3,4-dihydroxy-2-butanone 4-phosphate synthase [Ignicoccus pacificus DSM 13166]